MDSFRSKYLLRGCAKTLLGFTTLCSWVVAQAHGFGQRFDLPLPLWLWITGAGATLVLTFAALTVFARKSDFGTGFLKTLDLLRFAPLLRLAHPLAQVMRTIACALFLLTLVAGFFGNPDAYSNLIVTMVWVLWWVGMAFFSVLIGDLWEIVNPLPTIYRTVARVAGGRESLCLTYPAWLGAWPAVTQFLAFAWAELVWLDKDVPRALATVLLAYASLSWFGMLLFGVEVWRNQADAFAMAFRVLGRFSPFELRASTITEGARLHLRLYGAGLLNKDPVSNSIAAFVLLMLSTVTFDGFHETPLMDRIGTEAQNCRPFAEALFTIASWTGINESQLFNTIMLLLFSLSFMLIFRFFSMCMLRLASLKSSEEISNMHMNAMVWSLVPIAAAYHLAHYVSLLMTSGQFIIPLASDPFGWEWNLFGTGGYAVNLGLVSPFVYWYGSVALIIIGHVLAVVVAHVEAKRIFISHKGAVLSQLPMLLLMVVYTSLSLWIMAQPIVG